ncbi:TniQ family protein [Brevibacillus formosus]|uniref:TniQ family protein n=1 Tax=Brevibacillus formosus TaxID=54913 RepID=UPI0018CE9C3A|nr:TniQ family protein [Brevibacillus formosus]MBG9941018.1 hypothetical protein [Brevibacillus formosus]
MDTYSSINLDEIPLSSPSRLYSLKPMGLGTAAIESMTSFIARLARAHCLKVGDLFTQVLFPILNKQYTNNIMIEGGNGFYDWAHSLNGLTSNAHEFVELLENMTGNSGLGNLTLLKYRHLIPNRRLLRRKKCWCPNCFREMKDEGKDIYEPLIWTIQAVNVCTRHNVELRNRCIYCTRSQLMLERRSNPGYCVHCHRWLGSNEDSSTKIEEWGVVKSISIEQLIFDAKCSSKREVIRNNLVRLVKIISNNNLSDFAMKCSIPKSTFWGWYTGKNLPPLEEVLRICNKFGLNLTDFYCGSLAFNSNGYVISSRRERLVKRDFTSAPIHEIRKKMRLLVIDSQKEVLSVKRMAKALKCNKKTLYKYCGDFCKIQAIKHKMYKSRCKITRILMINKLVYRVFLQIIEKDGLPTAKRVEKMIGQNAIFKERSIRMCYYKIREYHS